MIRNLDDAKVSPKEFVREMLMVDLEILTRYWEERHEDALEAMTLRERMAVRIQVAKFENRMMKMLGYEPQITDPNALTPADFGE